MVRLGAADLRGIVDVGAELAAAEDLATFRADVPHVMRRLVAADIASYNEIDPGSDVAVAAVDPPDAMFDGAVDVLGAYAMQNPLIARYAVTRDARTLKFSDFMTLRKLHRLDIYRELYGRVGTEHQIAFALPGGPGLVVGVSLNRRRGDFSERDRAVLDLVRPALVQAHRAARDRAALAAVLAAENDGARTAVVVLGPHCTVDAATPAGRRWLAAHASAGPGDRLPSPLREWASGRRGPGQASFADHDGSRLEVRFLPAAPGRAAALVLRWLAVPDEGVQALGLTPREADVLRLVARGLPNAAIARALGVSDRTVGKHLERVFAKLGVTNRTAAVRRASTAPSAEPDAGPRLPVSRTSGVGGQA